jgi:hypothetical protein
MERVNGIGITLTQETKARGMKSQCGFANLLIYLIEKVDSSRPKRYPTVSWQ